MWGGDSLRTRVLAVDPRGVLGDHLGSTTAVGRDGVEFDGVGSVAEATEELPRADCAVVDTDAVEAPIGRVADAAPSVPVVAVTGDDGADQTAAALAAGATSAVPKGALAEAPGAVADRLVELGRDDTGIRGMIDGLDVPVTVHEIETGRILTANERACELFGRERSELLAAGVDVVEEVCDEATTGGERSAGDEHPLRLAIRQADETGATTREWAFETGEGDRKWMTASVETARIDGTRCAVATIREVTERKRLERTYREVFEAVGDGLVVHDPETAEIVDVNEQFCRMNGYEREELVGESVDVITPSGNEYDYEEAADLIAKARRGATPLFEWRNQRKNGETFPVEVHLSVAEVRGEERVLASVREITERKRREREYERIFDGIDDPITMHDPETAAPIDVNEAFCELLGYPREEILDMTIDDWSPDDEEYTLERGREFIQEAVESDDPRETEWVVETADGERRWLEVKGTSIEVAGETRYVSIDRDVTERRRREREYEQIFNGVNDSIVVHDPETGEMVDTNETFCELLGYSREEILELGTAGVSVLEDGFTEERAENVIAEAMAEGAMGPFEWKVETADGDHRLLEVTATPAEIGGEQRHLSLMRDVTKRRRREKEFEQIFDGVHDAIAVYDPETLDIKDANESFLDLLGVDDVGSIHEEGIENYMATDQGFTPDRGLEIHQRAVETGEVETFDWRARTRDGELRWLEVKLTPAEIGGEQVTIASHRDVTERKRREREYEQIFNGVNDGIAIQDPETADLVDVNETFLDRVGYEDVEEALERGIEGFSVTEAGYTKARARELCDRVVETGDPETVEWQIETRDGERRVLEATVAPAVIGGEQRVVSMQRDVTERRRSERQLRTIAERVDEVIYVGSPDLEEVYYLSPAYEEIWDQPVERMYEDASAFVERVHPDDEEWFDELIEGIRSDLTDPDREPQDTYQYEYRVVHDDGEVRWVETRGYPVYDDAGSLDRFVTINRDVTERKEREETLESFQEATTELTTAETPAAACRTAVATATEVFDLPRVAVHLYDEDTGELSPVAGTDAVPAVENLPVWTAKDDSPWEVFVDGTMDVVDVGETPSLSVGAGGSALLVALSGHGVMTVWAEESGAAGEVVETANILAATLEGALNHLAGERRLESHREQLREQTERAQRLDRIAELTQRVEAAITGQSDRVGVERAVCERLTDIDPFTAAWVAAPDVGTDRLQSRTVVGVSEDHAVRALSTSPNEGTPRDRHPAYDAWESGRVSVTTDLVGTGTGGAWRETLLREGAQAVCAVPLSYEGITHGVLTVVADDPGAFDDRERETLDQLGTSIGYALTAVERQRALESDATVELEFRTDSDELPFARLATATECQVRHDRTVRRRDGSIRVVYSLFGDLPADLGTVADETLPGEVEVRSTREGEAVVERTGDTWFGAVVSEYGGVLRRGQATEAEATLVVELPTEADVRRFVDRLEARVPGIELVAQRQHQAHGTSTTEIGAKLEATLTDRQREALETALEMGYFEWPREASGQEVADRMGISQPTLNKHLRVAKRDTLDLVVESASE